MKKTKIIPINRKNPNKKHIEFCAKIIKNGGLVAFPTETVYGLGANALDEVAVKNIFIAKGRPQDNPLIVHIADKKELKTLAKEIPKLANDLIEEFWPGPLTVVLKKNKIVPDTITAGLDTVAIRMPDNKIALELIKASKVPIAAPSANISGKPSPTSANHVIEDMYGKIDAIIKSIDTDIGIESTVIDFTSKSPRILRPGKITKENIEKIIGKINTKNPHSKKSIANPKSPGMKYRHYAPNAKVIIFDSVKNLKKRIMPLNKNNETYAIITKTRINNLPKNISVFKAKSVSEMTKNMFKKFREFDNKKIDVIFVEKQKEKGLGYSLMERVKKAAKAK